MNPKEELMKLAGNLADTAAGLARIAKCLADANEDVDDEEENVCPCKNCELDGNDSHCNSCFVCEDCEVDDCPYADDEDVVDDEEDDEDEDERVYSQEEVDDIRDNYESLLSSHKEVITTLVDTMQKIMKRLGNAKTVAKNHELMKAIERDVVSSTSKIKEITENL